MVMSAAVDYQPAGGALFQNPFGRELSIADEDSDAEEIHEADEGRSVPGRYR